ncbi:MAG TPA: SDR family oxidoreductase [Solirubrobacteraceae bacterium]|jgi:NAD(P)-dependent dehydrogenase (short-subunit alcohol dehydrogenase family)|nr:SDR family oxidoreductase [Solirubrobacteraceae bacterium]
MAMVLEGRVALITGGTRGLGRATAEAFAAAGAELVIVGRREDSCAAAAREIAAASGREVLPYACHVGHWDELDGLVAAAYERFGRVDVLVNNAGSSPLYDRVDGVSQELWRKTIDLNLSGPFRLTALIGTRMAAGAGGSIINVSSAASRYPTPDVIPYAAAKAGLNAITIAFAHAFGPSVRVNGLVAGTFLTDISAHWDPEAFGRAAGAFALERGGRPEEIVGTMLYLAGDASSYTTGALIDVDGGYRPPQRP